MVSKRVGAVLATLALIGSVSAPAPPAKAAAAPRAPFRVGLIGDSGYDDRGQANLLRVREGTNSGALAFVVHDGDIWLGGTRCSDERLRQVREVFDGFRTLVYAPGDNEWQDCPNPDGRLPAIRRVFFAAPVSLGARPIEQRRQPDFPENA